MSETKPPKTHHTDLQIRSQSVQHVLRSSIRKAGTVLGGIGVFLVGGIVVTAIAAWLFGEFAERVMSGRTQAVDESILRWISGYHSELIDKAALEVTALGTGTVVLMIVCVSGLFLGITRHRYSALLLLVATGGGLVLNTVLKLFFDRPRPSVFEWGTQAVSSSFPSGHAMSATIVYSTVAYLAARLSSRLWLRWLTMFVAAIIIALIALSRIYLGVHYPSDVLAGAIVGLAWAAFCMATLEAIQRFAQRSAPEIQRDEAPAPKNVGS